MKKIQPKILIIEDEPEISSILQAYLIRRGFHVVETPSGREALALIQTFQPDVIVLDFGLKDLNGWEVLRQMRQMDTQTSVIVMTGQRLTAEKIDDMKALGVVKFFYKPLILAKLGLAIARLTYRNSADSAALEDSSTGTIFVENNPVPQDDIHQLINLLGIIRNKCESFLLNKEEGFYADKNETELILMSVEILKEITSVVDSALDRIEQMREHHG